MVVLHKMVALTGALLLAGCAEEARRPNVVLITIDTLRADRLPMYGAEVAAPNLQRLADEGVVFENCWAPSSWTVPSTASLYTGVYPIQHGVEMGIKLGGKADEKDIELIRIPSDIETIPTLMQSLGYRTFAVTDNMNICETLGFARGFDQFKNSIYRGAEYVNGRLAKWADEIKAGGPWFVYLHYMDPHAPYHGRDPWFEAVPTPDKHRRNLPRYDSEISYVDQHIGDALEMLGMDEETVVIVMSDHGEEFGDHGEGGHEFRLYTELTRVPLIVRAPGVEPARRRVAQNVSLVDVLPTLRSILGAPASDQDEGADLTAYFDGSAQPAPRHIFSMRTKVTPRTTFEKRAVIYENHKFIQTMPNDRKELFDLAADPAEKDNIADQRPATATELQLQWEAFSKDARSWRREGVDLSFDQDTVEALKQLGYVGDK